MSKETSPHLARVSLAFFGSDKMGSITYQIHCSIRKPSPLALVSIPSLVGTVVRGNTRLDDLMAARLSSTLMQMVKTGRLNPSGDHIHNGQPYWFAYRFMALTNRVEKLPVYDRDIFVYELMMTVPHLSEKLAPMRFLKIKQQDIHSFIVGVDAWKKTVVAPSKFLFPKEIFKSMIIGKQKGIKIRLK